MSFQFPHDPTNIVPKCLDLSIQFIPIFIFIGTSMHHKAPRKENAKHSK